MKNRFRYISLLLRRNRQVPNSCGSYILGPLHFLWNVRPRIQVEYVRDRKMYFSPRIFIHFQQDERSNTNNLIISLPRIPIL